MRLFMALLGTLVVHALAGAATVQAERCTSVIQEDGSEYIVNTCNACRKVNIRRKRRGIAMPVMRTYNIQPRSKFPTSFKGIGRSRITSEILCEGGQGAGTNIMKPKARKTTQKKCVALKTSVTGVVILVNSCNSCRGVAVERYATNGKSMGRQAYKINPLSVIQVQSKGSAQVGYLADVPCPS